MKNSALIIFVRNPQLGKVKTRLAASIGDDSALKVYHDLLFHTMSATQNLDCDKFVFYDEFIDFDDLWPNEVFKKKLQFGKDLGIKMQNAFQQLFDVGYKKCVIIGSDLFDLKSETVEKAFDMLAYNQAVIGPAEDGGYYILGLQSMIGSIFTDKDWGTPSVFSATVKDLMSYKIDFLEVLNDIDTVADLENSGYYHFQISKVQYGKIPRANK